MNVGNSERAAGDTVGHIQAAPLEQEQQSFVIHYVSGDETRSYELKFGAGPSSFQADHLIFAINPNRLRVMIDADTLSDGAFGSY